ncbi:MAG: NAD(P)/FAD-dependent oxidoreductase [Candidatus Andersenbacteria bacterium]
MKKILILGGGFAGVETYLHLHKLLHPAGEHDVSIELISKTNYFTFSPMLHEAATGSVAREHVIQPLREILHCCGQDFHQAEIQRVDSEQKIVVTDKGEYSYDILVVALGVEQGYFGVTGAAEHALALKWLPGAIAIRNRIINSFELASEMHDKKDRHPLDKYLHFIIVGGGATGVELAGQISDLVSKEMKKFYGDVPIELCKITLMHAGERVLEQLSPKASQKAQRRLEELGVAVQTKQRVTEVQADGVLLASGEKVESNSIFWTAGTESTLGNIMSGSLLDERKLLRITPTFQAAGDDSIFGLGDCARVQDEAFAYPPTAQAAVQAAALASKNVIRLLEGTPLKQKKYRHKGDIIPIGNWYAILERKPLRSSGILAWFLRRVVFLRTMYGWGNRVQIAFDWCISLFLPRDTSEF